MCSSVPVCAFQSVYVCVTEILTLADGEVGAPGVATHTHHQRLPIQAVAFIALELDGACGVQVVLQHPAMWYLLRDVAALRR